MGIGSNRRGSVVWSRTTAKVVQKWPAGLFLALTFAAATSLGLPLIQSASVLHDIGWLLMHPAWGLDFLCYKSCAANRTVLDSRPHYSSLGGTISLDRGLFLLALPHTRTGDNGVMEIHSSSVNSNPQQSVYRYAGNRRFRLDLLSNLREALHKEELAEAQRAETKRERVFASTIPSLVDEG